MQNDIFNGFFSPTIDQPQQQSTLLWFGLAEGADTGPLEATKHICSLFITYASMTSFSILAGSGALGTPLRYPMQMQRMKRYASKQETNARSATVVCKHVSRFVWPAFGMAHTQIPKILGLMFSHLPTHYN
jgi:hypothetical protein